MKVVELKDHNRVTLMTRVFNETTQRLAIDGEAELWVPSRPALEAASQAQIEMPLAA